MPFPRLDRSLLRPRPLRERKNLLRIEELAADPDAPPPLPAEYEQTLAEIAARIRAAGRNNRPVVLAFGAHAVKNGLGPVLIRLMESGAVTHLATNGAGFIHDLEFALQGASSEDVRENTAAGTFGMWEETGRLTNLALAVGAAAGLGYGEALGTLIEEEGLDIPLPEELRAGVERALRSTDGGETEAGALLDLLDLLRGHGLSGGRLNASFPWKRYSTAAAARRLGVPFTAHPCFGQDVIYTHPLNHGGALGRCALRDFLSFAHSISRLAGGVYLSVGSAVMSPMIFEKSFSMANNSALRETGAPLTTHTIVVNDLQRAAWDWNAGEPPKEHPAYYLRWEKTFHRMGGTYYRAALDNRVFLGNLYHLLKEISPAEKDPAAGGGKR